MLTHQRLQTHSPTKKLFHKLENSIQTYINYCKTHAMATHYGGMGDTSMENPETQDIDNNNQDNFQEENNIQQLIQKTEQLRQTIEDRDNDHRDVIHQLECDTHENLGISCSISYMCYIGQCDLNNTFFRLLQVWCTPGRTVCIEYTT